MGLLGQVRDLEHDVGDFSRDYIYPALGSVYPDGLRQRRVVSTTKGGKTKKRRKKKKRTRKRRT